MTTTLDVDVETLSLACVDAVPIPFDWSYGFPDRWQSFEVGTCWAKNNQPDGHPTDVNGRCDHPDCAGYELEDDSVEGPMMNYLYPVADCVYDVGHDCFTAFDEASALLIVGLPLCVVLFEDDEDGPPSPSDGIALTGGGMDLSWEICEGYVRLGHCPPVHFCDLPVMAERFTDRHRLVIDAMRRTVQHTVTRGLRRGDRLDRIEADMMTR